MNQDDGYNIILRKIAKNLKKLRKQKGLTQMEMIEHGFNMIHYQRLESGKYSMNLHTLYRLSIIFDVSVQSLLK